MLRPPEVHDAHGAPSLLRTLAATLVCAVLLASSSDRGAAHDLELSKAQQEAVRRMATHLRARGAGVSQADVQIANEVLSGFRGHELSHILDPLRRELGHSAKDLPVERVVRAVAISRRYADAMVAGRAIAWSLASEDPEDRAKGILLAAAEPDLQRLKQAVHGMAADRRPDVRAGAARLAVVLRWLDSGEVHTGPRWRRAVALSLLRDPDPRVISNSVFSLVEMDDPTVVADAHRLLGDHRANKPEERGLLRGGCDTVSNSALIALVGRLYIRAAPGASKPNGPSAESFSEWWSQRDRRIVFDPPTPPWTMVLDEVLCLRTGGRHRFDIGKRTYEFILEKFGKGQGLDGPVETTTLVLRESGKNGPGPDILVCGNPSSRLGTVCHVTVGGGSATWYAATLSAPSHREGEARIRVRLWHSR